MPTQIQDTLESQGRGGRRSFRLTPSRLKQEERELGDKFSAIRGKLAEISSSLTQREIYVKKIRKQFKTAKDELEQEFTPKPPEHVI